MRVFLIKVLRPGMYKNIFIIKTILLKYHTKFRIRHFFLEVEWISKKYNSAPIQYCIQVFELIKTCYNIVNKYQIRIKSCLDYLYLLIDSKARLESFKLKVITLKE